MIPMSEDLMRYLLEGDQHRAGAADSQFASLTPREQWLVREAAVMGFVRGARTAPGERVPAASTIVRSVIEECQVRPYLYPTLAGSVPHIIRKLVGSHEPLPRATLLDAVCLLTTLCVDEAGGVVDGLVSDGLLAETPDGLREVVG